MPASAASLQAVRNFTYCFALQQSHLNRSSASPVKALDCFYKATGLHGQTHSDVVMILFNWPRLTFKNSSSNDFNANVDEFLKIH
jgi:hypothetical protein